MANGDNVRVEMNQRLYFNGAQTIAYDETTDGIAYMAQNVLLPSFLSKSIVNMVMSNFDISTFASLLVTAGLANVMRNQPAASLTVVARKCLSFGLEFLTPKLSL
jgi:hypothetical protein